MSKNPFALSPEEEKELESLLLSALTEREKLLNAASICLANATSISTLVHTIQQLNTRLTNTPFAFVTTAEEKEDE